MVRVLLFGDIVGRGGRQALAQILPELKRQYQPDLVVANAENLAHGAGITEKTVKEMLAAGVDVLTGGNHSFENEQGLALFDMPELPVLRPLNYINRPGRGFLIWSKVSPAIMVINLMGQVFMKEEAENLENPYEAIEQFLSQNPEPKIKIVDLHAEATAEKNALARFLDGRVSAVLGTHTHIQTVDAEILAKGTAFITDAGMCGSKNSIIGFKIEPIVVSAGNPEVFLEIEEGGPYLVNGVCVEIDEKSALALKIERIYKEFA